MKKVTLFRSKALALSVMMAFTLTACGGGTSTSNNTNNKADTVDGTENTVNKPVVNKQDIVTMPVVQFETSMGKITLELNDKDAPKSVENFLNYVNSGHYNGTIFHRVIDGFMIQGGGFDNTMTEKPSQASIENEADNGLKNDVGTIAMARTSAPHSASSQFFINVNNNNSLNHTGKNSMGWGYAVFGKVTEGMDVVNKIKGVATGNKNGHQNVPIETVSIISATVIKK